MGLSEVLTEWTRPTDCWPLQRLGRRMEDREHPGPQASDAAGPPSHVEMNEESQSRWRGKKGTTS